MQNLITVLWLLLKKLIHVYCIIIVLCVCYTLSKDQRTSEKKKRFQLYYCIIKPKNWRAKMYLPIPSTHAHQIFKFIPKSYQQYPIKEIWPCNRF